ncbi:hypothetical protein SeMB42_g06620 [Synchytrium endobioticum]|uniref:Phosphoribulokinase/uridine kinase domain-containing protein n=1 Tax=Synchytrium endobioticum TaxID=286115 RepID=A0A507CCN2_9FUNG|nr:hypothetical protein SeMB42_g06620 [Synchytrium endobioticum]TPX39280.1 hypothetical protein SeLEV6574_g07332 [Synchytrium endobioticum]
MSTVIVGVGGASCSGKSTLTEWLVKIFPHSAIYHMDKHYLPDSQVPVKNGILDWDCAEALDFNAFVAGLKTLPHKEVESVLSPNRPAISDSQVSSSTVRELKDQVRQVLCKRPNTSFWFLDGFLLYWDKRVMDLMNIKIALHTRYDELKRRRGTRPGYETIEGYWVEPPNYFDEYVWPNYLKHNKPILKASGDLEKDQDHGVLEIDRLTIIDTEICPVEEALRRAVACILDQL